MTVETVKRLMYASFFGMVAYFGVIETHHSTGFIYLTGQHTLGLLSWFCVVIAAAGATISAALWIRQTFEDFEEGAQFIIALLCGVTTVFWASYSAVHLHQWTGTSAAVAQMLSFILPIALASVMRVEEELAPA